MVPESYEQLLTALIKMRTDAKWSQTRLAKELGVAQSTVGEWESRANKVSVEVAIKWARAFGVALVLEPANEARAGELVDLAAHLPPGEVEDLAALVRRLTAPDVPEEVKSIARGFLRGVSGRKAS